MKIKFWIVCFLFIGLTTFGQRKKPTIKINSASVLAKLDNVSAEIYKNNFYLINSKSGKDIKKDSILLKVNSQKNLLSDCKISVLNVKSNQFYLISWRENENTTTKLKIEDATIIYTEICDFLTKAKVFSNFQKTTNIKEIRFLDANQTVSETIDKVRKEGNEFKMLADGDVVLTNKKGETKWTFSTTEKGYIPKKK